MIYRINEQFFVNLPLSGERGGYPNGYCGFVHVEDVAAAHILAMEESKASGRLICSSSVAHWYDVLAMLRAKYPMYPFETKYDMIDLKQTFCFNCKLVKFALNVS